MSKYIDLTGLSRFLAKCKDLFLSKEDAAVIKGTGTNSAVQKGAGAVASGVSSYAEGRDTTASGDYSHTEGRDTTASEEYSHAEGYYTTASGSFSHAEGDTTNANGSGSHAEGRDTTASGNHSHAEGNNTTASGLSSHAEGADTVASNSYEHAQGKHNKSNKKTTGTDAEKLAGSTIHSVGIGTSDDDKKNAFEIMQNGDHYIYGIGGYDGTNPGNAETVQTVINSKYQKPIGGIPASDMTGSVRRCLELADNSATLDRYIIEGGHGLKFTATNNSYLLRIEDGNDEYVYLLSCNDDPTNQLVTALTHSTDRHVSFYIYDSSLLIWASYGCKISLLSLKENGAIDSEIIDVMPEDDVEEIVPDRYATDLDLALKQDKATAFTGIYRLKLSFPSGNEIYQFVWAIDSDEPIIYTFGYILHDVVLMFRNNDEDLNFLRHDDDIYVSVVDYGTFFITPVIGNISDVSEPSQIPQEAIIFNPVIPYYKPGSGIPASDMSASVQQDLAKAATAYQKPADGIPASDIKEGVIPDVSQFVTRSVNDLINYYTKSQTYTQEEVRALIATIHQFHYEVYPTIADVTTPANNVLYLIGPTGTGTDMYEEYIWPNAQQGFVKIGDTSIDLSDYVTTGALNTALALKEDISNKVTSLSAQSTDNQYPSAKCVYDALYENAIISLTVNSAGTASDLIGLKVTVTNTDTSEQISEQTWNGTPLVVRIKAGVNYIVSVQSHPDYVTPVAQSFKSELASIRAITFEYVYSSVIDLSYRDTDGQKQTVQNTANSYIARVAGDYKFPAVYGNAIKNGAANADAYTRRGSTYTADFVNYKGIQITSPYIETDTGESIASAVLLWQTGANLISNVSFVNGYVSFTVNSIPTENGLAVLAVKDANGDIMWSWILWLTTDTLTAETFTNHTEVDYDLMPENLFVIWNEGRTNYGTAMIQWGRKDAFVPNIPGSTTQMTVYDIDGNAITPGTALGSAIGVFGTDADQSADKTVVNSIKNPGMFFTRYDSTSNNWNNLAWFNNFWNAAETSSASLADNQDTAIKTIYDPCPFGWMLSAGRAFTGFTTTGGGTSTASQFNVVGSWSNGWNFKRNSADATGNKFIASGYRARGSGAFTDVGSFVSCWSFAPNSQTYARGLSFGSGFVYPANGSGRSNGFAVRPSRELP